MSEPTPTSTARCYLDDAEGHARYGPCAGELTAHELAPGSVAYVCAAHREHLSVR